MQYLKYIFLILLLSLITHSVFSQAAHKYLVNGTVVNQVTNEPLPGANIIVMGTVLGTIANNEGYFTLEKIPPGSYKIKASMMGFKPAIKDVLVRANETQHLQFKLKETVIETPELVVTASKRRQTFQDSPNSLSVVTSGDIERQNEAYLDEALKNAPGVHFTVSNINIRGSSGFSRGAGSRVLLLVDGVPMMPGDSGDIKWDVIPTTQVKQVEIVKGAGSALYGSYALGGIINVITQEPSAEPKTSVRMAAGIHDKPYWDEWQWTDRTLHFSQFDVSHSRGWKKFHFLVSANRRQDTGYSQNTDSQTWSTLGKIRYSFSPQTYLIFNARLNIRKGGQLLLWKNQHDALMVPEENIGLTTTSDKLNLNSIFRKVVHQNLAYKVQASYFRNTWRTPFIDHTDESRANDIRLESQFDIEPWEKHSVTTGSEVRFDFIKATIFDNHDAFGWAYYLQDEIHLLSNLAMTTGLRYDLHIIDRDRTDQEISPKLGLVYRPGPLTSVRLSAGKGFRAPTMAEMFTRTMTSGFLVEKNENLKAERSASYELGANQILGENVYVDVALFRTDYWDLIEGQPDETNTIRFQNLTRARISGVEFNLKTMWWKRHLGLDLNYTFMNPRDLTLDRTLVYRPRHLATVSLALNYGLLGVNLDYRYNSRIEEVLLYPDDIRVANKMLDGKIALDFKGYKLSFDVDNMLQYNYVPVERNLAPIRRFMLTLSTTY